MCLGGALTAWFPCCVEDRKKNRKGRKRDSSTKRDSRGQRRSQRRSHSRGRPSRSSLRHSRTVEDLDHTLDELGLPGLDHRKSNLSVSKHSSEISTVGRISASNNQKIELNTLRSSRVSKTQDDTLPKMRKSEQELRKIRDSRRHRQTFTGEIAKTAAPRLAEEPVLEDLCASYGIESTRGGANIESEEKVQLLKHIKRRSQMESTNEEELEKRHSQVTQELQTTNDGISKRQRLKNFCYNCLDID